MPPTEVTVKREDQRTYIDALADQFTKFHESKLLGLKEPSVDQVEGQVALVPEGQKLVSVKPFLDEYLAKPRRRRGQARVKDVQSFVDLTSRFASAESLVFANPAREKPQFLAVLDYHPATMVATDADWGEHKILYEPPLSDEWKAWNDRNGKSMQQAEFAEFVEDRISDVLDASIDGDPGLKELATLVGGSFASPSTLVQLSRGLQVRVESTVRNVVTLDSGEIDIVYTEEHKDGVAGNHLKVANLFAIAIPVFYNGEKYRIPVRLRYRVQGGRMTWYYQLIRPERSFDDAFEGIVATVEKDTNLGVVLGTPESAT